MFHFTLKHFLSGDAVVNNEYSPVRINSTKELHILYFSGSVVLVEIKDNLPIRLEVALGVITCKGDDYNTIQYFLLAWSTVALT